MPILDLLFAIFAAFLLTFARFIWLGCNLIYLEWQQQIREHEIRRLEREIVIQRFKCAAANPDAAAILIAWEDARIRLLGPSDWGIYRRFFQRDLGGEPRKVILSVEEAEAEKSADSGYPPTENPADTN